MRREGSTCGPAKGLLYLCGHCVGEYSEEPVVCDQGNIGLELKEVLVQIGYLNSQYLLKDSLQVQIEKTS